MTVETQNTTKIDPRAIVESGVTIGRNVEIEPYAVIKRGVTLEDNVVIKSHAYIEGFTTIGEGSVIWPFASIGAKTQDLKFKGEKTFVNIGKRCQIREFVTINSSCGEGTAVTIGDDCLIMAYCHVAHNCTVGDRVIMSNGVTLAGHVDVESDVVIGGLTPIHQFCRIGAYSMVGGATRITRDVPPFLIVGEVPFRVGGVNRVGLKRRGFALEKRRLIFDMYKILYRSELSYKQALEEIALKFQGIEEAEYFLNFCRATKRGIAGFSEVEKEGDEEV